MSDKISINSNENSGIRIFHIIYLFIFFFTVAGLILLSVIFTSPKDDAAYKEVYISETWEISKLKAEEEIILNSYKLIDPDKGIYRIPVKRAMELIVKEEK